MRNAPAVWCGGALRKSKICVLCAVRQLAAYPCGYKLYYKHQHHQPPYEGADHRPAAAVEALHQRSADAARADDTERRCVLEVDVKAVDGGGNEARGELRDNAVADLLERRAAHGVKAFKDVGVQILDSGYVHLGYHADGADRLRDNAAGGAGAGDADPHQCPDDAGYRPYHKDEYAHDVGDGLGHDVERGEERAERKMSLGIKQLKEDPWEAIEVKYPVGSKHTAKVRNFTNFGIFVELEEGVDGLIHISDLSWTKKVKHPSEFTQVGASIDVVVLEIDKENRRLSLGHKQLEENPWDTYETLYTPGSVHTGKITEMMDKGAVITLNEGGEGFATPKHLVKEDGTQAQLGEELEFKVIEFVKETKRIILSHSRTFEAAKDEVKAPRKHNTAKKEAAPVINNVAASTTLGDLDALAELKAKMEKGE